MMLKKRILSLAAALIAALAMQAQTDPEYLMEIGAGVGLTSYEGDFNGNITQCSKPSAMLLYRYHANPRMGWRASLGYGKLAGKSADANTFYPDYGNKWGDSNNFYEFDNTMVDLNVGFEYNFWPYGTGRDYRGAKRLTPFVSIGLGLTYADTADNGVVAVNLPIGLGLKYKLADRVNLNLEWQMHFTTSDKLDGVVDPYHIESTGLFKNRDCYSALTLAITYSFKAKCRVCHNADE